MKPMHNKLKPLKLRREARLIRRFELRINEEALYKIDAWRRKQLFIPSMGEAVRRLIKIGLNVPQKESESN